MEDPVVGVRGKFTRYEAWNWLMFAAAYKPHRYRAGSIVVNLERGQLAHSLRYMGKAWRWPEPNVRRFLKRLKGEGMISAATDAGITLITICNYDPYQFAGRGSDAVSDAPLGAQATHQRRRKEESKQGNNKTKEREGNSIREGCPRKRGEEGASNGSPAHSVSGEGPEMTAPASPTPPSLLNSQNSQDVARQIARLKIIADATAKYGTEGLEPFYRLGFPEWRDATNAELKRAGDGLRFLESFIGAQTKGGAGSVGNQTSA
jgi:hypothetical protein